MKDPVSYFTGDEELRFARLKAQCDLLKVALAISANSPPDGLGMAIRDNAILSRIASARNFPDELPRIRVWETADVDLPVGDVAASVDLRGNLRLSIAFVSDGPDARPAVERALVSSAGTVAFGPQVHYDT